jgi:hypothetical protein
MNAIFDLKDGQVLDIKNNRGYSPGGCPTCEHGSVAVEQLVITLTDFVIEVTVVETGLGAYFVLRDDPRTCYTITMDDVIKLFDIDAENTTQADFVAHVVKMTKKWTTHLADYKITITSNDYDQDDVDRCLDY